MATTFTQATLANTYRDDFRDSDNYHRILFNSGVGLQARELTQLQTILQKQIERFGNNIFKEGAVVKPGGVNINPQYEFIKLDETDPSHVLPEVSTLVGKTVEGQSSGVIATIIEAVAAGGGDPATLYVKYTNTSSAQTSTDTNTRRMSSNELMDLSGGGVLKVKLSTVADPSTGVGTQVTILGGIYYARSNFVLTQSQSKIISKYTDDPSADIGFKAVEEVITANDNNALYDNQGTVPNVSAPGADRYRITLTIAERNEISVNENFIHIATVNNGVIYNAVAVEDAYNVPALHVAKRIFENSGDYTVKPFLVNFEKDSENTHLLLNVSDGVVVVDGFRAARTFPTRIRIQKPTATTTINNEPIHVDYGSNVLVDVSVGGSANTQGIPNFNEMELLNLRSAINHGGSTVGTARVSAITKSGTDLKMHLSSITMNSGQAFRNVKSVGTSTDNYFNIKLENSKAVLKEPLKRRAFFVLPRSRPRSVSDLIYTAQRKYTGQSANGAGVIGLNGLTGGEAYTQTDDFVFAKADSDVAITSPTIDLSANTVTFGTSGPVATIAGSSNIEYASYISKTQTAPKTKTLTTFNLVNTVDSDGNGFQTLNLKRADIFEIDEITNAADSNESYANRFILDNGQRSTAYLPGRLVVKKGQSAPVGNVFVKYKFFEPSSNGDYFSVNSYTGQVDYDKIPSYNLNGSVIPLTDVLDFRSVADSAGNFGTSGSTMIELPKVDTTITADVTYHLSQAAKLSITNKAQLRYIVGENGFFPEPPDRQAGTLPLYDIILNANTLNDSDVQISKFNFKRFTMKDIGKLEKRVDKLEEMTTLSLLEVDTRHFEVLDSAGNNRTKAGFFVDDFRSHRGGDLSVTNEYRASIDAKEHRLRPMTRDDSIRMIYDSDASTNTIRKGDNIYVKHDEEVYINQTTASSAIKINPFAVTIYDGTITLSPASDEWKDVERLPDLIVQTGGTLFSPIPAFNFNDYVNEWCGTTNDNPNKRVVTDEAIHTLVDDRVIEKKSVPFMRSRKVFFKAEGLRPNTRVFPFLDGVNISDLTNGAGGHSAFQFHSDNAVDFGNTLDRITVHPDGATTLVTDANGRVSGSFIVPNNDQTQIKTGTKQFKLLDISVDNEENAGTIAFTPYTAEGVLDTKQAEYVSTRIVMTQGQLNYQEGSGGEGPDLKGKVYQRNNVWKDEGYDTLTKAQRDAIDMARFQTYAMITEQRRNAIVSQTQFITDYVRDRIAEATYLKGKALLPGGGIPQDNGDGYEGDFDPVGSDGTNPDVYSDGY